MPIYRATTKNTKQKGGKKGRLLARMWRNGTPAHFDTTIENSMEVPCK